MFRLHVSGPRALFVRPEFKLDRVSYDIMPPGIARTIFESIRTTQSVAWTIKRIDVLNPIRFSPREVDDSGRVTIALADVSYVLTADFELTSYALEDENYGLHASKFCKAVQKQRFSRPVMLGQPGWPATISLLGENEPSPEVHPENANSEVDLGWMMLALHSQGGGMRQYFRPTMRRGIVEVPEYGSEDIAR